LESARFVFNDPNVAVLYHRPFGQDLVWEIGLDGQYRQPSPSGDAPIGYWEDVEDFQLEVFDRSMQIFLVKFENDSVQVIWKRQI
jgi:hypothetical protein